MTDWLEFSTALITSRTPEQLADKYIGILSSELKLSNGLLLFPDQEGRRLITHKLPGSWLVGDFDSPLAHVLQSGEVKLLKAEDLVFWRSDRQLMTLAEKVGIFDILCLIPVFSEQEKVESILLISGSSDLIEEALANTTFQKLQLLFSRQWELLTEMEQKSLSQKLLRESLMDIEKKADQEKQANELSLTLIGKSTAMQALREQIVVAAGFSLSVMLQGQTGTGKELVAKAIHKLSSRCRAPFITINCAAIPENLLESELFGYTKGAFSGADENKLGLIAQADKGILFLDEIGDMPLSLQAKLLRVLETRTFRPLGGNKEIHSDFCVISATHLNLPEKVHQKAFRQDLYYRLCQYPINLPSLCCRKEDIYPLCEFFIEAFNQQHSTSICGIDCQALDLLQQYHFPGNVRELKHLIEFACVHTSDRQAVRAEHLEARIESFQRESTAAEREALTLIRERESSGEGRAYADTYCSDGESFKIGDLKLALSNYEALIIKERLTHYSGSRRKAAESLGIPIRTLAYKCQKLGIKSA
ncbi:sigma-54 dependent transcriptional regulator [Vibrio sp. JC009]|uniref:sigma-54 interaction domain-containing protein n=1 Tax=Vibrio sp. JC009 TaxID=2912314 RepID=UPI0023B1F70A|nr:sigma-54 dependent transcriptional regulator [Vibrio sp. JC009]WED24548.1 sigma-54 dependent transcriptional regulator [Vibrio sp. JC009]